MTALILAVAFILGITIAYLVGREDGADAELNLWCESAEDSGPTPSHALPQLPQKRNLP